MTDPREILARIRERADAATEGPWGWEDGRTLIAGGDPDVIVLESYGYDEAGIDVGDPADAELIASSRTIIPALLDALEPLLERHSPHEDSPDEDHLVCGGCYNADYGEYDPYPCEDVEIITKALKKVSNALA